jgi:hypothetical protein
MPVEDRLPSEAEPFVQNDSLPSEMADEFHLASDVSVQIDLEDDERL